MGFSEEVDREYKDADIVLNFSESESFSITCLEALYFGRPVIATNCDGPAEIIEHNKTGLLVANRSIEAMENAMLELAKNTDLRNVMGSKATQSVRKKFNIENTSPGNVLNAYTFVLVEPQVVVVYAGVTRIMDADELRFIIGHELGHVRLGHTWLNSLMGGMSGIPSPYLAAVLLYFSFRWWNRACEYSADRAGLLACGKPEKAASALIKIAGGLSTARSPEARRQVLNRIEAEDDELKNNLREMMSTHPMTVRRLKALREYAVSQEYHCLQAQVNNAHPI